MEPPETRYAQSGDLSIAYQVHGTGEHDLLFSGTTASNVETVWTLPEAHRFFERLGCFARVIRFDRRDTGVSDPIRDDLTLEAHVADALAVMDAAGAERPMLFGGLDGARAMAALAATRPERAAGLIALIPTVRGAADTPEVAEVVARSLVGDDWPSGLIDVWAPDWAGDPVRRDRLLRYIRTSSSPRQARRLLAMSLHSDIGEVLPLVQAPTLVLALADTPVSEAEQRQFAELIPGAVLRRMPGNSLMIYGLDVDLLADVIEEFVTGTAPPPVSSRILATVLFTDVVGSTDRVARVGDAAWAQVLQRHHEAVAVAVAAHEGELVKTLGDGVLAVFSGPAQGVRCATRAIAEARTAGLDLRTGLHTGEVERTGADVAGLAVHLAARIMARARPGEVLVSRTVKDLVVGSRLRFEDRGEHELKGIPEPWALYAAQD